MGRSNRLDSAASGSAPQDSAQKEEAQRAEEAKRLAAQREANKRKRQHLVGAVNRAHAKTEAENFLEQTPFELEELLATLADNWSDFKAEYAKIFDDVLDEDQQQALEKVFVDTENTYMATRSKIRKRISDLMPKVDAHPQPVAQQPLKVEIHQPEATVNIPNSWGHFSGDYAEWPAFRDRFKARIHDRKDVLITQKWGHLRASLSGYALQAMGQWKDTDENYQHAWNRLCSQFNDDYMAVQTLIQKLLNIPKLQRATSEGLRNINDTVHGCLSQLTSYVSVTNWDPLVIFLVVDKLDNDTRKDWEKHRHSLRATSTLHGSNPNINAFGAEDMDEAASVNASQAASQTDEAAGPSVVLPTWPQMEEFLDRQAKILRDINNSTQNANPHASATNANRGHGQQSQQAQKKNASKQPHVNENLPPCLLCRIRHAIFCCPTWLAMGMDERETYQKTNRLCITCVQPLHGNSPCWGKPNWAKPCPVCLAAGETIYHNSTLCRRAEAKRAQRMLTMQVGQPSTSKQSKATTKKD